MRIWEQRESKCTSQLPVLLGMGHRCEFTVTIYSAWLEFPPTSWSVFGGHVVTSSESLLSKRA